MTPPPDDAVARTALAWRRVAVAAGVCLVVCLHGALRGDATMLVPAMPLVALVMAAVTVSGRDHAIEPVVRRRFRLTLVAALVQVASTVWVVVQAITL